MPQPVKIFANNLKPGQGNSDQRNPAASWKKELSRATCSASDLLEQLGLEAHSRLIEHQPDFRCLVTESYIKKIRAGDINDPLLRQVLPLVEENNPETQQAGRYDPVGDINAIASPGLLHKYHGRALLISTGACAIHCRYCFRRHYPYQQSSCSSSALDEALNYLESHPEIDEVILSGGDPLVLDNEKLSALIEQLQTITSLDTLRIHSRLPVVLPSRIDNSLIQLLKDSRLNVVMVIHSNHANELQQAEQACLSRLHEAGVTLLNQSVLLHGVNDDSGTLISLSKRLFQCSTLPYYLHLLDPVTGAMHFDVGRQDALRLVSKMQQQLPGYLVPKLVQEIAGKQSKSAIFHI